MKRPYPEKPKLLKWQTYTQAKRDAIIEDFWREYFTQYPENGSLDELNVMRRSFEARKSVKNAVSRNPRATFDEASKQVGSYESFKASHRTILPQITPEAPPLSSWRTHGASLTHYETL